MIATSEPSTPGLDTRTLIDPLWQLSEADGQQPALTFVDFETSKDGVARRMTRARLHDRTRAVAARLADRYEPGERVAILAPQGLHYVVGFVAAMRAGMVAVPLFTPDLPGHGDRLERVLDDCSPVCALTDSTSFEQVREFLDQRATSLRECVAVDDIDDEYGQDYRFPEIDPERLAYLQYTSGSTRIPTGVELTHANAVANARQAVAAYSGNSPEAVSVSWLPLFHDMGLVLAVAAPLVGGVPSVLMDPVAFLQQPSRWLRLLSTNPKAVSAAPNFAYDYCAAKVTEREKMWLQLDSVLSLINGSEPVRAGTIERFNEAFAECGLAPETHRCSFGLAEATVFVSVTDPVRPPTVVDLSRESLSTGTAEPAKPDTPTSSLVSCGNPVGQDVAIVDPSSSEALPDGAVGEMWVHGPNTGRGYWTWDKAESDAVFHARVESPGYEGDWLRTGDLGVRYDGEFFVTGRIKDLIIVDGRNHYPQDVEDTVEAAHSSIRGHHSAAFSITVDDAERLVVVAEYSKRVDVEQRDSDEISSAVRRAVSAEHGVGLHELVLVEPDTVPRTSSGKVARRSCQERYADDQLAEGSSDE